MDPSEEADRLLNSVWAAIAGDRYIPVDPIVISRELGIDVFDADLESSTSGMIIKKVGYDPRILLNRADSPNRSRFTCAHELGHYVSHADDPDQYEFIDRRDPLSSTGQNEEEKFANAFAASLLMPDDEVQKRSKEGASTVELAWQFRVSAEAMEYRLRNLGLLSARS
jgi:Zn-dependent peptidase ImmA (M78 family)